ncbi:MiaB/RimO family radical SAM methylthiotransferase [Fundidesulfovibrio butyratiphilus]
MRFYLFTLGCKINQYESQSLRESWTDQGHEETGDPALADVALVHTCAVTAGAVADSRRAVRRAARLAPNARVVVAGCAAQVDPETFRALPGVVRVVPQTLKPGLARWPGEAALPDADIAWDAQQDAWPNFSVRGSHRSRPVLKVQDGCSHCCTYCIVPRARGGPRSRPAAAIESEARRVLDSGHREIVLTGINLAQYLAPDDGGDFWDMLARLEAALAPDWAGRARLRLSSLDPGMLGPKALEVLKASAEGPGMICPHLHVSLQSAAPAVLAAMGRSHYHAEDVLGFLDRLGRAWPTFGLGADILTGFPGETEADFRATLDFCRQAPLSYAHVFAYSKRPGTVAAKARDQVPDAEKKARSLALRELTRRRKLDFVARLAEKSALTVAPERLDPWSGVCEYYVECAMASGPYPPGRELATVRPVAATEAELRVETP